MHQFSYSYIATVRHKTLVGQIFDGFGTARKSVEKILVADHTNEKYVVHYLSSQYLADKTLVDCYTIVSKSAKVLCCTASMQNKIT